MDGLAHNTWLHSHSMPGGMPTTSSDKLEIDPSTMPAVETTKKPVKPSDKPIIDSTKVQHIVNIFQHSLFDKENHSAEGANTLKDLQNNINDNKYGP